MEYYEILFGKNSNQKKDNINNKMKRNFKKDVVKSDSRKYKLKPYLVNGNMMKNVNDENNNNNNNNNNINNINNNELNDNID